MKDHAIAVSRVFLLAALLALLPAPVASQGDSVLVRVVRVIDGDTIQVCCCSAGYINPFTLDLEAQIREVAESQEAGPLIGPGWSASGSGPALGTVPRRQHSDSEPCCGLLSQPLRQLAR